MRVLLLGLDNSILKNNSKLARRSREYGDMVERYIVVVPSLSRCFEKISEKVLVYGVDAKSKIVGLFRNYKLATKIIKEDKIDVITVQDQYFLAFLGIILSKQFKIGLEIQVHGWEKFGGIRKIVAKYAIPRAESVRVVSQRLKKQLIEDFNVLEKKITVVPISFSFNVNDIESNLDKKLNETVVFLTIGRLVPVKNIAMQIISVSEIYKKHKNIELRIVGEGCEKEKLLKLVDQLKAKEYIKFYGWQDHLDKFYARADVFLLSSDSEGWGMVVLEAASYELPIIMTDVGCAGEVIKDNISGRVVPVGDAEKFQDCMNDLINNKHLRIELGKNAKKALANLPTKKQTLELYKKSWTNALRQ